MKNHLLKSVALFFILIGNMLAFSQHKLSKMEMTFVHTDSSISTCISQQAKVLFATNTGQITAKCIDENPIMNNTRLDSVFQNLNFLFSATLQESLSKILASQNTGNSYKLSGYIEFNGELEQCAVQISFVNLKNRGQLEDLKADIVIHVSREHLKKTALLNLGITTYQVNILGANINFTH